MRLCSGLTFAYMAQRFPALNLFSCEPDPAHYAVAACYAHPWADAAVGSRWQPHRSVSLHHETSQQFMHRIETAYPGENEQIFDPALFFLDAHGYGFTWPLLEEVRYYTRKFRGGFLLIDDFRVPRLNSTSTTDAVGAPVGTDEEEFGYDTYGAQECSFAYIQGELPKDVPWQLFYPRSPAPLLGDMAHNRSLEAVYDVRTRGEPPRSPCHDNGRCTGLAGLTKPKPRGWGLIAFGSLALLPVDKWLPHLVRRGQW